MAVNVKKSYVWTVVYEMNTKAVFYSNKNYLSSSEIKIAFIFISWTTVHTYDFHIFAVINPSLHSFITNQHNNQFPIGLLAQLVEHCSRILEVVGSNPVLAWIFSGLIFTTA